MELTYEDYDSYEDYMYYEHYVPNRLFNKDEEEKYYYILEEYLEVGRYENQEE